MEEKSASTTVSSKDSKQFQHKNYVVSNSKEFLENNNNGSAVYLGGEEDYGEEHNISIMPIPAKNAISHKLHVGANQIIVQNAMKKSGYDKTGMLISQEEAKKYGIYIDYTKYKDASVVLTTPKDNDNKTQSTYRYYFVEALDEKTQGAIAVQHFNYDHNRKLESLHKRYEKIKGNNDKTDEKKLEDIEKSITIENKNHIFRKIIRDSEIKYGYKNFKNENNLDELKNNVQIFIESLPVNEKNNLKSELFKNNKSVDENIIGIINSYNSKNTNTFALNEVNKLNETISFFRTLNDKENKLPIIDARNTHSPTEYIGKYLAATSMYGRFVTDKESQIAVQKEISSNLTQEFDKNNYLQTYYFGKDASDICKSTMSNIVNKPKEQQVSLTHEKEKQHNRTEPSVDMSL